MENNQTAARSARRFLTERVRDDWDWPNTPEFWSASDEEVRGVTEFRERFYGTTSEPDSEPEEGAGANPYQFDSPDSIGDAVEQKRQRRKRKRRELQEEEMKWNEGMQCFVARRDAWTGAAAVKKYGRRHSTEDAPLSTPNPPADPPEDEQLHLTGSLPPPPEVSSTKNDPADPLIPLAHRLLPDNPIRASIKPKVYADIFNNIVVSGRSPSVPVNLADMTSALVVGWKENGEWPPKAQPLDPLAGRKRSALAGIKAENGDGQFLAHHPHMKRGMESVKRIFHLAGPHDSSTTATPDNKGSDLSSAKANHTSEKKT
jgi:hypothetical protein